MTHEVYVPPGRLKEHGVPYSTTWCRHLEKQGRFPAPVVFGPHKHGYRLSEIEDWVKARVG